MNLVPNEKKYWEFIRHLRNDRAIQKGFVEQVHIKKKEQEKYMHDFNNCYYLCIEDGKPVGYIGEINDDIRLAVVTQHQKKGIGKFMLNEFMKLRPNSIAKVKLGNMASINLFYSCGFRCISTDLNFHYFVR